MWFDVMDRSTITVESGAVSQLLDKSGNGRHAAQSTSTDRPLYSANGWDGVRPAILYSSTSSENLQITSNLFQPADLPIIAAAAIDVKDTGSANNQNYVCWGGVSGGSRFFLYRSGFCAAGSFSPFGSATSIVGKTVIVGTKNGTSGELTSNGASTATGATLTVPTLDAWRLFNYVSGSRQLTDPFGELIILSTYSLYMRQRIEGYLAWKWGFGNKLSASHPFRNRPPLIGD
jgi:hypothetical protein